jgi:hypothetical protein
MVPNLGIHHGQVVGRVIGREGRDELGIERVVGLLDDVERDALLLLVDRSQRFQAGVLGALHGRDGESRGPAARRCRATGRHDHQNCAQQGNGAFGHLLPSPPKASAQPKHTPQQSDRSILVHLLHW